MGIRDRAGVYFADRYGLVEAASIEPVPGREPSPRELKALVLEGRRGGLGRLFTEPQFPPAAARVVAREANLTLTLVDPIGGVPGRGADPRVDAFQPPPVCPGAPGCPVGSARGRPAPSVALPPASQSTLTPAQLFPEISLPWTSAPRPLTATPSCPLSWIQLSSTFVPGPANTPQPWFHRSQATWWFTRIS